MHGAAFIRQNRKTLTSRVAASLFLLLAICLATPPGASGQGSRTITLKEAKRIASQKNVSVRKAENDVEAQSASATAEWGDFLPNLNLRLSPTQTYGTVFDQATGELSQQQLRRASGRAQAELTLFNGFADFASLRKAKRTLGAEEHALRRTRQDIVFEAVKRFLSVLKNREQVTVQQKNVESRRKQLQKIKEMRKAGSKPASDVYQQQATVAEAERALLQARRELRLSRTRLKQTLELDPSDTYEFKAPSTGAKTPAPGTYEVERLLQRAYGSRRDLKAQRDRIAAADQSMRVAKAGYWPRVSVTASVSSRYTSSLGGVDFSDQFLNVNRRESFGVSISIPLFSGLQTHGDVEQAEAKRQDAKLKLQSLRKEVTLEVRQAYLDYQSSEKDIEVAQKQKRAAKKALVAAQERYRLGATTLIELSETRSDFVRASSGLVQARYDHRIRQKQIEYQLGTLSANR
jgi:outer membrane protein